MEEREEMGCFDIYYFYNFVLNIIYNYFILVYDLILKKNNSYL